MREGDDGPIKIGTAVNPSSRLKELQGGNPRPLQLLGYFPGDARLEYRLHKHFAEWRIRGEWFSPDAPGLQRAVVAAGGIARAIEAELDAISTPLIRELFIALELDMSILDRAVAR